VIDIELSKIRPLDRFYIFFMSIFGIWMNV